MAAVEEEPTRSKLALSSVAGKLGQASGGHNRLAAGPDGTRGFALRRAGAAAAAAGAAADEARRQRQQQLGNQLYGRVSAIRPDLAGKITGCARPLRPPPPAPS